MKNLRLLSIIMGLVGTFYLSGATPQVQASTAPPVGVSAAFSKCYPYSVIGDADSCLELGQNCEDGSGIWCEYCEGYQHCIQW